MIDIKPPEEEFIEPTEEQLQAFRSEWAPVTSVDNTKLVQEVHELNKTLKEILREMRKRKA